MSVIIPAFNAEQWVVEAVGSVTAQTWTNIEIIVVDDGSTDQTVDVVESIADSRLRIQQQPNAGAAAARNSGMRLSRGEFIQFLDADDTLGSDKLALQIEALRVAPQASVASCAWGKFVTTPAATVFSPEPVWTESDPVRWMIRSLDGEGMMQPAAWLTPRSVTNAVGPWDETLSLHDDGEFFARVLLASSRNVFVPAARVHYRTVAGSLSRRRSRAAITSAFSVCVARHRYLLAASDTQSARRAIATQYAQFAYEFASAAPDLSSRAIAAIDELGVRPNNCVGGGVFRAITALMGFAAAQRVRGSVSGSRR